MKKTLLILLFSTFTLLPLSQSHAAPPLTSQQKTELELCKSADSTNNYDPATGKCTNPGRPELAGGTNSYLSTFVNLLLFIAGAVAVIVIIVGGIRYITSTGDAMRIKQAKDTVLYGIIGLVIALISYAIVNTLINQLAGI